ncbi:hypothetical protein [uncultured Dokdonia sp.]|uniref:hypothetical protein n=1 Tax=uncultured Dokdonia sp. TaxID=575653 RepID=UPI0030ECF1B1|tara:strand:- start:83237 stop:83797 length:561 start_codon:yes stop_codon:yes gene_type:complete
MKKYIGSIIKEVIVVVAGILIALFINTWNEDRKDQKYMDAINIAIHKEFQESVKEIDEKFVLQKKLFDTLRAYQNNNTLSLHDVVRKGGGVYLPSIRINSWKAIASSKIELMEYEKVSVLANIEEGKEVLNMKADKFGDYLYEHSSSTGAVEKKLALSFLNDLIGTGKAIQQEINKIIERDSLPTQ